MQIDSSNFLIGGFDMKLSMTKAEYQAFLEYCVFLSENPNPCSLCGSYERLYCLGCKGKKDWKKLDQEKSAAISDLFKNADIVKHLSSVQQYTNVSRKLSDLQSFKDSLEKEIFDFEHSIALDD